MYELEYLYEQLKAKMVEEEYLIALDSVSESCYNIHEVQRAVENNLSMIDEAASKNRFTIIDKLKANFTKTETVVKKYKEAALKCKPIGLQYNGFKTYVTDQQIEKMINEGINYLKKFDVSKASEEELRQYIKDSNNNVQFNKIAEIYGLTGPGIVSYKVVTSEKDKEITKSDIADAVKFVENYNKTIAALQAKAQKMNAEFSDFAKNNTIIGMSKTTGDINELRRKALIHQKSLLNIAQNSYYECIFQKYNSQLKQCKQIVVKAANYNPRNLKESYKIQDYIDAMYAFHEN